MRQLMQWSIDGSYGNLAAWGVFPQVLVGRHYILVPEPRVVRLGVLWPQVLQWQK